MAQTSEAERPVPAASGSGRGTRRPTYSSRLALYNRQIVAELRKVIWPTRNELVTYTIVSVIFVTFMVAFVALCDYIFTRGALSIFG